MVGLNLSSVSEIWDQWKCMSSRGFSGLSNTLRRGCGEGFFSFLGFCVSLGDMDMWKISLL